MDRRVAAARSSAARCRWRQLRWRGCSGQLLLVQLLARAGGCSFACEVTLRGGECGSADSGWQLSAAVDSADWCEVACGSQHFGRGGCRAETTWVAMLAEQVASISESNQRTLAAFESLGGANVSCRGPGADDADYSDAKRTCISPVEDLAECEQLCRDDIGCHGFEYHEGVWDQCRYAESGNFDVHRRNDCSDGLPPGVLVPGWFEPGCTRRVDSGICERWKRLPVLASESLHLYGGYSCRLKKRSGAALSGEIAGCPFTRVVFMLLVLAGCSALGCLIYLWCKIKVPDSEVSTRGSPHSAHGCETVPIGPLSARENGWTNGPTDTADQEAWQVDHVAADAPRFLPPPSPAHLGQSLEPPDSPAETIEATS